MLGRKKDKPSDTAENASQGKSAEKDSAATESPAATPPRTAASAPTAGNRARLGDILVREGAITPAQLNEALEKKKTSRKFLGQVLVEMEFIDQKTLISFLVKQCKIPHISLMDYVINEKLFEIVSQDLCKEYHLLPIDKLGKILTVAMVDPLDIEALEQVRAACPNLKIKPILCDWHHYDTVARRLFDQEPVDASEVSASTFGLSEKKSPQPRAESEDQDPDEGVDDVVAQLVEEANSNAKSDPRDAAEKAGKGEASPAKPPDGQLADALKKQAEEALGNAMGAALAQHESQLAELTKAVAQAVQAAEAAARTAQGAPPEEDNVQPFPGTRQARAKKASKPELDALEALDGPGIRTRADNRVRALLDAESPLEGYTFEDFYPGKANALTLKVGRAVAQKPGDEFTPLVVYGGVGLGKTHFINAIGNELLANHPDLRVGYLSGSRFCSRLQEATQRNALDAFRGHYCHWDVFVLDDAHFLADRPHVQEEFLQIMDALQHEGRQLIIACGKAPESVEGFEPGLVSRFAGGIIVSLEAPEREVRMRILASQAEKGGAQVEQEVCTLIATRIPDDIRKMCGSLRKVIAFARLVEQDITCELASEILSHLGVVEAA